MLWRNQEGLKHYRGGRKKNPSHLFNPLALNFVTLLWSRIQPREHIQHSVHISYIVQTTDTVITKHTYAHLASSFHIENIHLYIIAMYRFWYRATKYIQRNEDWIKREQSVLLSSGWDDITEHQSCGSEHVAWLWHWLVAVVVRSAASAMSQWQNPVQHKVHSW